MRQKVGLSLLILSLACLIPLSQTQGATNEQLLARVPATAASKGLPVYAYLSDEVGETYTLTITTAANLDKSGLPYLTLDSGHEPAEYAIAKPRRIHQPKTALSQLTTCIYNDGQNTIVRPTDQQALSLSEAGYAIQWLADRPIPPPQPSSIAKERKVAANPLIAAILTSIQPNTVSNLTSQLSGEEPASIGGSNYTILTRHTLSGEPSQKANQFAFEHLSQLGLTTTYAPWTSHGISNQNIVAILPGHTASNEIILITAHIDDMPPGPRAPGADDNGSGTIGVLLAAEYLANLRLQRTVRFVLFTGEEQGLYGSAVYAQQARDASNNIQGVVNMDMISWHTTGTDPVVELHTRSNSFLGYSNDLFIANIYSNVTIDYGLNGIIWPTVVADGEWASDHSRFWIQGYPAILAIENTGHGFFNPYYHTTNDILSRLDLAYYTANIKAALGTVATLATIEGDGCNYRFYPQSTNLASGAYTGTVNVLAWTSCCWTVTSSADWLTANSNSCGNGLVYYSVSANDALTGRTAYLSIDDALFTVTQIGTTKSPIIINQPQSIIARRGQTASFSVLAEGQNPIYYQWFQNTNLLPTATNSSYTTGPVTLSARGNYTVLVSNEFGSVVSSNALLRIVNAEPTIWDLLVNSTNSTAELSR